jgi:GTPase Era involved in 16S rRNA processing
MIKQIGTAARAELERYLESRVVPGLTREGEVRVERRRKGA